MAAVAPASWGEAGGSVARDSRDEVDAPQVAERSRATREVRRHFAVPHTPALVPARVLREERQFCLVRTEAAELAAELPGRVRHHAASRIELPAVGDWVGVQLGPAEGKAVVRAVLPRQSAFVRKEAGAHTEGQVVAANVDVVFLVNGLDRDLNLLRLECWLTVVWESGAAPVVLLNEADLRPNDSRGRHTTTHRELIHVPGRGILIGTPGMRELRLWADEEGLGRAFGHVEALASRRLKRERQDW